MVRGRIDLYLPSADGGVMVDFKTDDVRPGTAINRRMQAYAVQVRLYADAVARIIGRPIGQSHVVFLRARRIERVD